MKYKKTIYSLLILLTFSQYSLGQSIDFNKADYNKEGNSNPFAKYEYKSSSQWEAVEKNKKQAPLPREQAYFDNKIENPLNAAQQKKYKHLIANSSQMSGCWDKAASIYKVDPWLLMAIAKTESSFNNVALNVNNNKSVDIGMMQINTTWLPTLRRYGIEKEHLLNPCTSVFVGAWILAQNIQHFGYNQDGIGAYNSPGNVKIRRNYAQKVYASYRELIADFYVKR